MAEGLFDAVKRASLLTDEVIVSYSGGKDSAVTLDLAARFFKTVHCFFMFQIPGLSFQEATLRWAEDRYGIEIYRTPHWVLSSLYRGGVYCRPDPTVKLLRISDTYAHVRSVFDCHWIAAGERAKDSVVRNAMIKKSGSVDATRGRFYPLAYWDKAQVVAYIKANKLKVSAESQVMGHSFRGFDPKDLMTIQDKYPDDYAKVVKAFPQIGVAIARERMYGQSR